MADRRQGRIINELPHGENKWCSHDNWHASAVAENDRPQVAFYCSGNTKAIVKIADLIPRTPRADEMQPSKKARKE